MCKNIFSYVANADEMIGTVFHEKAVPVQCIDKVEQVVVFEKDDYNYMVKYSGHGLGYTAVKVHDPIVNDYVNLEDYGKTWTNNEKNELNIRKIVFKYIPHGLISEKEENLGTGLFCGEIGETFDYYDNVKVTLIESKIYSKDNKYKDVILC